MRQGVDVSGRQVGLVPRSGYPSSSHSSSLMRRADAADTAVVKIFCDHQRQRLARNRRETNFWSWKIALP